MNGCGAPAAFVCAARIASNEKPCGVSAAARPSRATVSMTSPASFDALQCARDRQGRHDRVAAVERAGDAVHQSGGKRTAARRRGSAPASGGWRRWRSGPCAPIPAGLRRRSPGRRASDAAVQPPRSGRRSLGTDHHPDRIDRGVVEKRRKAVREAGAFHQHSDIALEFRPLPARIPRPAATIRATVSGVFRMSATPRLFTAVLHSMIYAFALAQSNEMMNIWAKPWSAYSLCIAVQ